MDEAQLGGLAAPTGTGPPSAEIPIVMFLDMNAWVEMAKGVAGRDPDWERRLGCLGDLIRSNRLQIPLSAGLYLELWHRGTQVSREDVGRLMRDLSGYLSFASLQFVREREIDAYVDRHVGGLSRTSTSDLLGQGVCHAFGSPFGRFRFVESLASADGSVAEGQSVPAPEEWMAIELEGPEWEWFNLVGKQEIVELAGLERKPQHRLGDARVRDEQAVRDLLQGDSKVRSRTRDLIVVQELQALSDQIGEGCSKRQLSPLALYFDAKAGGTPADAMRAFVDGVPSVDATVTLREWKHRDLGHRWDQHDEADLMNLAAAVPYADITITERRWAHLVRASGLARRCGTSVHALRDIDSVLEELARV